MITSLTITLEDYENISSLNEQNIIFKDCSVCVLSNGMCFNQYKCTSIWNLKSEENFDENIVDILYQGTAILISFDQETEIGINMISFNSEDNIFSYKIKYLSHMCYQKVYRNVP